MNKMWYCHECGKVHAFNRQQAAPVRQTWQQLAADGAKDVAEVILGMAILLAFFLGIPWLGYLVLTP